MDCTVDITTIIANIITIGGILYAFFVFLKKNSKDIITINDRLNVLTSRRRFNKIIMKLIKNPAKIDELVIKTKKSKIKNGNTIGVAVYEKRFELLYLKNQLLIKRGIILMLYELLNDFNTFGLILIVSFDDFVLRYIEYLKYFKNYHDDDTVVYDIRIKFSDSHIVAKLCFSDETVNKLDDLLSNKPENVDISFISFKEIDIIDRTIKQKFFLILLHSLLQEMIYGMIITF